MAQGMIMRRGGGSALPPAGTTLEACGWDQIDAVAKAGLADTYWNVGDTKAIELSTGEFASLQIIGFGHDNLVAGGKAPITFCFKDGMVTRRQVNATNTNVGGYSGSALYTTINSTIYNSLPAGLRGVMKEVYKLTSVGNQSATIETTEELLFLLSEIEVHGSRTYSATGEGTQYAFFTDGGSKIKKVAGTASVWWNRSPKISVTTNFCAVTEVGAADSGGANTLYGVALGLCV